MRSTATVFILTALIAFAVACAGAAPPAPTPAQAPTPTPEPQETLASLFNIEPHRIHTIRDPLPTSPRPAILTGCHAHTIDPETFAFTASGQMPTRGRPNRAHSDVIIIEGYFPSLARGGCYEMVVTYAGLGRYDLNWTIPVQIMHYRLSDHDLGVRRIN